MTREVGESPAEGDTPSPEYRHLYVHVPYCARRCSYCDFAIAVRRVVPWEAFARRVAGELARRVGAPLAAPLATVYLGGGTPSRLGPDGVAALCAVLRQAGAWAPGAEVTLEANPEDVTPEAVAAWARAGVNRVSLGVQSFSPVLLQWMHRVHDVEASVRAARLVRAGGIASLSVDLIFATPAPLARDWEAEVGGLLGLEPDHVSLYGLTIEERTPVARWQARGAVDPASEERYADEFLWLHERLEGGGFVHYEVSNYGRPGHRARHNSAYWQGVPYLGVGPSAHGFDGSSRRWNLSAVTAWERAVDEGQDPVAGSERLTAGNREAEAVYLGLRTVDGLPVRPDEEGLVGRWIAAGWMVPIPSVGGGAGRVRCTPEGWLRLDALAADLTAVRSRW
ncbi:MAG: radical SAM family heme chaperone HemW [Gemmatimonadetes bacterium]|nr:radical SAM family heme chaperone HemW [Gemmatimonadota bacterium]